MRTDWGRGCVNDASVKNEEPGAKVRPASDIV
jgi:hypothetical protein